MHTLQGEMEMWNKGGKGGGGGISREGGGVSMLAIQGSSLMFGNLRNRVKEGEKESGWRCSPSLYGLCRV